jgi:hypothetical protein
LEGGAAVDVADVVVLPLVGGLAIVDVLPTEPSPPPPPATFLLLLTPLFEVMFVIISDIYNSYDCDIVLLDVDKKLNRM